MPTCPICHDDIDYLMYNATLSEGGIATLYAECDIHFHEKHTETDLTIFSCPKCYTLLFDDQDHAIAFLSGNYHFEPTIETDDRPLWSFQYPPDPPGQEPNMQAKCLICKWEGPLEELATQPVSLDEIGSISACPQCGATNLDKATPEIVFYTST